jgi:hypothetical protein
MPGFITGSVGGLAGQVPISNLLLVTAILSPAIVNANTTAEQTFTITGLPAATPGNLGAALVAVSKPTAQAGLGIVGARLVGAGQVAITFSNNTAGGITPTASELYSFLLVA